MKSASIAVFIALLSLVLAADKSVHGQSSGAITELDPGTAIAVDLSHRFRLDLYTGREKSEEIHNSKVKFGGGVTVRMKPVLKRFLDAFDTDKQHVLALAAIYEYSIASEQGETKREHKLMIDATGRYAFSSDLLFSDRNRLEFRWVNGEYHHRYRNRPTLERPFRLWKRDITPYIAGEAFWDQRYHKWNMFKGAAGIQIPVYRHASIEFFYERQHCVTCADPNTNIFGLNLLFAYKRHK
jgi:hypothetical protein